MNNQLNSVGVKCGVCGTALITVMSGPLPGCPQGVSVMQCPIDKTHMAVNAGPQSAPDTSAEQAAREKAWRAYADAIDVDYTAPTVRDDFETGWNAHARWQRERPVSEAEVEAAVQMWMRFACPRHDETPGGTIEEDMRAALEAARRVGADG